MSNLLTDPPTSPPQRAKRRLRLRHSTERRLVLGIVGAAALVAAVTTTAEPTTVEVANRLWSAAAVAVIALAASRSRRYPWLWLAGIATAASLGGPWVVAAAIALVAACVGAFGDLRNRPLGASVGALSSLALLHLPLEGFHGSSLVVSAIAAAPVLHSGYKHAPGREKQTAERVAAGVGIVLIVGTALFAGVAFLARGSLDDGVGHAKSGLQQIRNGNSEAAAGELAQSSDNFASAANKFGGILTVPARVIPLVSYQADALEGAAQTGEDLTSAAAAAARAAPYGDLKSSGGAIDLAAVTAMQDPAADAVTALAEAEASLASIDSTWLLPPVDDALSRFETDVAQALPQAELARDALVAMPGLLGGDGERNYLVLFTSPSEARNLGGFVGSYGVLTASGGDLDFSVSGSATELLRDSDLTGDDITVPGDKEFLSQYARFAPNQYLQNLTLSPDMGTTADLSRSIYQQITGVEVDGVIVVDPIGLAALLQLTGPVAVEGLDEPLTAENAADYLLFQQYVDYEGNADERRDLLEAAGRATFEELTTGDLPRPKRIADVLSPVVEGKHVMFHPFPDDERSVIADMGAAGAFAPDLSADVLSVRTSDAQANKLDYFLHRDISYEAAFDPDTGSVEATATVQLTNDAPASGLPDYIIGGQPPESGLPPGTNQVRVAVYSTLTALEAKVDGATVGIEPHRELGARVYIVVVTVPPGGVSTLTISLSGAIEPATDYRLQVLSQPSVHDSAFHLAVTSLDEAWAPHGGKGVPVQDNTASVSTELAKDEQFVVPFRRN